jgi:hypothetical protein
MAVSGIKVSGHLLTRSSATSLAKLNYIEIAPPIHVGLPNEGPWRPVIMNKGMELQSPLPGLVEALGRILVQDHLVWIIQLIGPREPDV